MPFDTLSGLSSEETVRTEAYEKQVADNLESFNPYRTQNPIESFSKWVLALCDNGRKQLTEGEFALAVAAYRKLDDTHIPDVTKQLGPVLPWFGFLGTADFSAYQRLFGG
jgi:hypothetical protein